MQKRHAQARIARKDLGVPGYDENLCANSPLRADASRNMNARSEPHLDSAALHLDVASRHMKFQKKVLIHASMIRNLF